MIKTGKIFLIFILAFAGSLFAAEIRVDVDQNEISTNDILTLRVSIVSNNNEKIENPNIQANDFKIQNIFPSFSSTSQYVNGSFSVKIVRTFTYTLIPQKTGKLTISNITAQAGNQKLKANDIHILVTKGDQSNPYVGKSQKNNSPQADTKKEIKNLKSDQAFFILPTVDKKSVYKGEEILLSYDIYTRVPIEGLQEVKKPELKSFIKNEIQVAQKQPEHVTLNGMNYSKVSLLKFQIVPLTVGEVSLEPLQAKVIYRPDQDNEDGDIFSFFKMSQPKVFDIKSRPLSVHVKTIPEANRPSDFIDLVGSFTIKSEINSSQVKAGDPVTYKIKLSGSSSVDSLKSLPVKFSDEFEVFENKTNSNKDQNGTVKTFEYILIPKKEGLYKIPQFKFSYFNTIKEQFESLQTEEFNVQVEKGNGVIVQQREQLQSPIAGQNKSEEIKFIKLKEPKSYIDLVLKILIMLNLLAFIYLIYKKVLPLFKFKENKIKKIKAKIANISDSQDFLGSVLIITFEIISLLINENANSMTNDQIKTKLIESGISDVDTAKLIEILDVCNTLRYGNVVLDSDNKNNIAAKLSAIYDLLF